MRVLDLVLTPRRHASLLQIVNLWDTKGAFDEDILKALKATVEQVLPMSLGPCPMPYLMNRLPFWNSKIPPAGKVPDHRSILRRRSCGIPAPARLGNSDEPKPVKGQGFYSPVMHGQGPRNLKPGGTGGLTRNCRLSTAAHHKPLSEHDA